MGSKTLIRDLTTGSVTKSLLLFAAPLMASNLLQTVYNMVDMVVVGQFVGSAGLSAVSIGSDILHLLTFIAMGLSGAGQVIISQFVGAGDRDSVRKTIGTLFTVVLACSIVISVVCFSCADPLLHAVNTPEEAWGYAKSYAITCFFGLFFIYGYNLVSAILRGMGDSHHPFLFIAVAALANLVLDLLFVAVFKLAAFGAALATVLGQALSFIWSLIYLYRRREAFGFDFRPESFRVDRRIFGMLMKLGLPMCLQSAAIQFSMLYVNSFLNAYGIVASAVTGIGNKLGSITSVITNALSTAGGSMVGQCIGARKTERVPRIIGVSMVIDLCFATILTLATVLFPREIFGLFNSDAEVLALAMTYVPCSVLLYYGFALRSPFFALINGVGYARLNLFVGLMDGVVCRIGLAMLLGVGLKFGIQGFWYGNALAGYTPFVIGLGFFLSGRWKTHNLVAAPVGEAE